MSIMAQKSTRLIAVLLATASVGMGTLLITSGGADAASLKVADGCWIDVEGEFINPASQLAASADAAVAQVAAEAATTAAGSDKARVAPDVTKSARADVLGRMKPGNPDQKAAMAKSLGETQTSPEDVWISRRSDGVIDGSLTVQVVAPGRYAVSEQHFALPQSTDCNQSQVD